MKLVRCALVATAASLFATPSFAQGSISHNLGPRADAAPQAMMFLRIPFGGEAREQTPRFGFALGAGCLNASSFSSQAGSDACDAKPFRALELSTGFGDEPWSLAFGGNGQRAELAAWSPRTGALSFAGEGGSGDWLWWGLGAAAVGVVLVLSSDNEPTLCSGDTIPNPIGGGCEPFVPIS